MLPRIRASFHVKQKRTLQKMWISGCRRFWCLKVWYRRTVHNTYSLNINSCVLHLNTFLMDFNRT